MKRGDWGRPRSENRIVTWCRLSGDSDQKSHMAVGERMLVLRVALLGVDEVGELVGVAHEEDRRVVADEVPVALPGVELQRKAAHVALVVGGAQLAGDGREAGEHLGLLADGGEDVGRRVARDVLGDGQRAVGAPALGVHRPLGDALAVLVGELLDQLVVLHQQRPARAGGHRILVVGDGGAGGGGEGLLAGIVLRHGGWLRGAGGCAQGALRQVRSKMIFPAAGHKAN